jgi:hypothetical protein
LIGASSDDTTPDSTTGVVLRGGSSDMTATRALRPGVAAVTPAQEHCRAAARSTSTP